MLTFLLLLFLSPKPDTSFSKEGLHIATVETDDPPQERKSMKGLEPRKNAMQTWRHTQTDRQAGRQAGRQTGRQTDRQTDGRTDGRTDRQTDNKTDRQPDRQTTDIVID